MPITAEDVRWTWQAQVSPEVAWSYADLKDAHRRRRGRRPAHRALPLPRGLLPRSCSTPTRARSCRSHVWSQVPFSRVAGEAPTGSATTWSPAGRSVSASWRPGAGAGAGAQRALLRSGAAAGSTGSIFRVVPDAATHVEQLLAGALDFACGITPADARAARDAAPTCASRLRRTASTTTSAGTRCARRSTTPEIRRALTLAIDRQALVDTLFAGYARVASSPIPSNVWAHDPHGRAAGPTIRPRRGAILARKGFADRDGDGIVERDGRPFAFELTTNSSNRTRTDALVMIQEQLRRVGIAATPRTIEIHALTEANLAHEFDATISGWAIDTTLDLKPVLPLQRERRRLQLRRATATPRSTGCSTRAQGRADPERRASRLSDRMQQILHAEQPYTFLWEPQRLCAVRARLEDVRPNALSSYFNLGVAAPRVGSGSREPRAAPGRPHDPRAPSSAPPPRSCCWLVLTVVFFLLRLLPGEPGAAFEDPRVPQRAARTPARDLRTRPAAARAVRALARRRRARRLGLLVQPAPAGRRSDPAARRCRPTLLLSPARARGRARASASPLGVAAAARAGIDPPIRSCASSRSRSGRCRPSGSG